MEMLVGTVAFLAVTGVVTIVSVLGTLAAWSLGGILVAVLLHIAVLRQDFTK